MLGEEKNVSNYELSDIHSPITTAQVYPGVSWRLPPNTHTTGNFARVLAEHHWGSG